MLKNLNGLDGILRNVKDAKYAPWGLVVQVLGYCIADYIDGFCTILLVFYCSRNYLLIMVEL